MKKKLADNHIKNLFRSYLLKKNYEKLVIFINKKKGGSVLLESLTDLNGTFEKIFNGSLVDYLNNSFDKLVDYSLFSEYLSQSLGAFDDRISENVFSFEQDFFLTDQQCEVLASLYMCHSEFGDDSFFYEAYVDNLLKNGLENKTGDELSDILSQSQIKYFDYRLYNSVINSSVKNKTFNSVKTCCVIF